MSLTEQAFQKWAFEVEQDLQELRALPIPPAPRPREVPYIYVHEKRHLSLCLFYDPKIHKLVVTLGLKDWEVERRGWPEELEELWRGVLSEEGHLKLLRKVTGLSLPEGESPA